MISKQEWASLQENQKYLMYVSNKKEIELMKVKLQILEERIEILNRAIKNK